MFDQVDDEDDPNRKKEMHEMLKETLIELSTELIAIHKQADRCYFHIACDSQRAKECVVLFVYSRSTARPPGYVEV